MNNKEKEIPYLELIPGIDAPKMEKNDMSEKNELNQEEKNEINILKKKILYSHNNNKGLRRYSGIPSLSTNFISGFNVINEKQMIKEEEDNFFGNQEDFYSSNDLSNEKKIEQLKNMQEKNDPFFIYKKNLKKKILVLIENQKEIKKQFEKEMIIYQNKIKYLETSKNQVFNESELLNLQNISKNNKEQIKRFEKEIEQKEKIKIGKKKEYYSKIKETLKLKENLLKEIKELQKIVNSVMKEKAKKYEEPIFLKKYDFVSNETKIELNNKIKSHKYINFEPESINIIHQMPGNNPFLSEI